MQCIFSANKDSFGDIAPISFYLEKKPLEIACKKNQLMAFKHKGFWKCMDVKRDRDELLKIYKKNKFKWKN